MAAVVSGRLALPAPAATTTTVTASADPSALGRAVTFTAAVTTAGGTPTGSVTFKDGSRVFGTVALSGGRAVFKTAALAAGNHTITASYLGAAEFAASSGSLTERVTAALIVDRATASKGSPQAVTGGQLSSVLAAAGQRWATVGGARILVAMAGVRIQLADLPSGVLAEVVGKTILIDRDAAGYGWFVDPTPRKDEEFTLSPSGQLRAIAPRAVDRIDLLTVVEHELGCIAGLGNLDPLADKLMAATLGAGVRRTL